MITPKVKILTIDTESQNKLKAIKKRIGSIIFESPLEGYLLR